MTDQDYSKIEREIERLESALTDIAKCDGQTLLGCAPEHDYEPELYPEEERAHQYGAYKAFAQCASIAREALAAVGEDND